MKCRKCGAENPDIAMFCYKCNSPLGSGGKYKPGQRYNPNPNPNPRYNPNPNPRYNPNPSDGKTVIEAGNDKGIISKIVPIVLCILIVILGISFGKDLFNMFDKSEDTSENIETYDDTGNNENRIITNTIDNSREDTYDEDYIIPYSSDRRLSSSDIAGLTKKEINYAKNEIYARNGRRFKSRELQNYFNSKSWYRGTIDPDDFNEDYMLSQIEYDNVYFLKRAEENY